MNLNLTIHRSAAAAASLLLALGVALSGCATTPASTAGSAAPSPMQPATSIHHANLEQAMVAAGLARDLSAQRMREIFGEPSQIKPARGDDPNAEIWTYHRASVIQVRDVVTGTRDVPYVDPITGEMRDIKESVMAVEHTTAHEDLHVLMLLGSVLQWKLETRIERTRY